MTRAPEKCETVEMSMKQGPEIIAVGGGKGGVGKSFIAAGIATSLANRGYDTVIVDLDLGGANLHTLLGIKYPETGIGDYIYRPHSRNLMDYTTDTPVKKLKLISGYGFIPGIANLNYFQKLKIIRAISRLENDYIILDLGAGTSYNVIDFFSMTQAGVIVTNAEPTAVLNAYEFIKNVLFRMFVKRFNKQKELVSIIKNFKKPEDQQGSSGSVSELISQIREADPEAARAMHEICKGFTPALVINMARGPVESLSEKLKAICRQFLSIDVAVLDAVPADDAAKACLLRMKHILVEDPDAPSSLAICEIAEKFLSGSIALGRQATDVVESSSDSVSERLVTGDREDRELAALIADFFSDISSDRAQDDTDTQADNEALDPQQYIEPDIRSDEQFLLPRFMPFDEMLDEEVKEEPTSAVLSRIIAISDAEDALLAIDSQDQLKAESREVGHKWLQCGYSLLAANQHNSAFKAFSRAYRLIPESLPAAVSAGAALISTNEHVEAAKILEKGLEIHEDHPFLLLNFALAQLKLERFDRCAAIIRKLKESGELDTRGRIIGVHAAFRQGDYRLAGELLGSLNGSCPWPESMLTWNRAVVHYRLGSMDETVSYLDQVLDNNPEDSAAWAMRGVSLWKMHEVDAAIENLDRAVNLENSNISFRAARGAAAFHAGLLDKAITDIGVITRLRPDNLKFKALHEAISARLET